MVCHALYLCNLGAIDQTYERSIAAMCATVDVANAIEADAVIFHVGSHLGTGFEAALGRIVPALEQILERATGDTWLAMENTAGAGDTIGRTIGELASPAGRARPSPTARYLPRLVPSLRVGL